jgi:hypothetical protein
MFTRMISVGALSLALVACGGATSESPNTGYPSEVRSNFITACTDAGSSQTICECMFTAIESSISFAEFTELERKGNDAIVSDSRIYDAALKCVSN